MIPAHLWFLYFLLLCLALMLPLAWLGDRLRTRTLGEAWDAAFRQLAGRICSEPSQTSPKGNLQFFWKKLLNIGG